MQLLQFSSDRRINSPLSEVKKVQPARINYFQIIYIHTEQVLYKFLTLHNTMPNYYELQLFTFALNKSHVN